MVRESCVDSERSTGIHECQGKYLCGSEPETEVIVDESLAPGIQQVVREPRRGSVAVTYKEYYDANGNFLHKEQVTKDKYRSIKGITHVGPGGSATSAEIAP